MNFAKFKETIGKYGSQPWEVMDCGDHFFGFQLDDDWVSICCGVDDPDDPNNIQEIIIDDKHAAHQLIKKLQEFLSSNKTLTM